MAASSCGQSGERMLDALLASVQFAGDSLVAIQAAGPYLPNSMFRSGRIVHLRSSALGAHEEVARGHPETVALSDRLQPAYQKILEKIREAVSDRGGGVRSTR
ncbi:hypothetical protein [Streptomyces sp. NPDC005046]